ncbi:MAG: hypothetical protein SangKO_080170 [Sandaracinaceae bacterium]
MRGCGAARDGSPPAHLPPPTTSGTVIRGTGVWWCFLVFGDFEIATAPRAVNSRAAK